MNTRERERESTSQKLGVIEENSFPPPTVGQQSADTWPTDYQQVTNRLAKDGKIRKINRTFRDLANHFVP